MSNIISEGVSISSIISTPLPKHNSSYAVIPHETIIEQIKKGIKDKGLVLTNEYYNGNLDNQILMGKYSITSELDNELNLMLVFGNSYNKQRKFKVVSGAEVIACSNGMLIGDMNNYTRKHTGNALSEALQTIDEQIDSIDRYLSTIIDHKQHLKQETITKKAQAELCGRLLIEEELITMTQLGIIQKEMLLPSFDHKVHEESAWGFYNAITHSLKKSHPVSFIEDHEKIHEFFVNEFELV